MKEAEVEEPEVEEPEVEEQEARGKILPQERAKDQRFLCESPRPLW